MSRNQHLQAVKLLQTLVRLRLEIASNYTELVTDDGVTLPSIQVLPGIEDIYYYCGTYSTGAICVLWATLHWLYHLPTSAATTDVLSLIYTT